MFEGRWVTSFLLGGIIRNLIINIKKKEMLTVIHQLCCFLGRPVKVNSPSDGIDFLYLKKENYSLTVMDIPGQVQ